MSEYRSTIGARTTYVSGATFRHRPVRYSPLVDLAIFEGDIVLGTLAAIDATPTQPEPDDQVTLGVAISGEQYRWPKGQIPYRVEKAFPRPERLAEAIAHWEARTRIRFIPVEEADLGRYPDRVLFVSQDGCWSSVGRRGGEQLVSIGEACSPGNAIHEIGHTVGLWHEQSREDRDEHVTIKLENVTPGYEHNFDQHVTDGDDVGPYDPASIMHYGAFAFSKSDQPTIVANNGAPIGQRLALSAGDVATVEALYRTQFP